MKSVEAWDMHCIRYRFTVFGTKYFHQFSVIPDRMKLVLNSVNPVNSVKSLDASETAHAIPCEIVFRVGWPARIQQTRTRAGHARIPCERGGSGAIPPRSCRFFAPHKPRWFRRAGRPNLARQRPGIRARMDAPQEVARCVPEKSCAPRR